MPLDELTEVSFGVIEPTAGAGGGGPGVGHAAVGPGLRGGEAEPGAGGFGRVEERRHIEPHGAPILAGRQAEFAGQGVPGPTLRGKRAAAVSTTTASLIWDTPQSTGAARPRPTGLPHTAADVGLLLGRNNVVAPAIKLRGVMILDERAESGSASTASRFFVVSLGETCLTYWAISNWAGLATPAARNWASVQRRCSQSRNPAQHQRQKQPLPACSKRRRADVVLRDQFHVGRDPRHTVGW